MGPILHPHVNSFVMQTTDAPSNILQIITPACKTSRPPDKRYRSQQYLT